jgi:ER degradation enhancer, mannosidase alpha-like 2
MHHTKTLLPLILLIAVSASAQQPDRKKLAAEVKAEFLHAWNGYKKYASGHDDLKPLTKTYHDWYPQPLLMTPVDSLDTMIVMGMKDEATQTKQYIIENLSFDKDIEVQNFEITIRLLGGLLTNYQLTGDKRLLSLAEDLGNRLLPVFNSPTGMPYRYVNLRTGKVRNPISNPAETGTLLIEFGTLSKLTGRAIFYEKAKRSLVETYRRRSAIGLVGEWINVETGLWTNTDSHISGAIDSYYEYLLKCWLLFDDQDCKRMWQDSIAAINRYLADETDRTVSLSAEGINSARPLRPLRLRGKSAPWNNYRRGAEDAEGAQRERAKPTGSRVQLKPDLWYGHADMNTGRRGATTYGALDAFFPAVLALSGDLERAKRLQESSFAMWKQAGIEPEEFDYRTGKITSPGYPLRPEIVESTYYLYHYTKDPRYLRMGEQMWNAFVKYCRTDEGYAALKSVVTKEKADSMQSFLFAETFKYFYLLFSPPKTLDFNNVIFNTEAHPIRRTWK